MNRKMTLIVIGGLFILGVFIYINNLKSKKYPDLNLGSGAEEQEKTSAPSETPRHTEEPKTSRGGTTKVKLSLSPNQNTKISITTNGELTLNNNDGEQHSIISDHPKLNGNVINPGDSLKVVFSETGEFEYYCKNHPEENGKIIVK
ncbi:TPA: hypothetical protein DDW69_02080 [candidate division CPR2 bacterium]|uniref:Blue (Type 1) copper domain protein n=1 Tax=candidate division CPR2 bacterium GW2011_GWC1_41_48 TaxID=1618344 RepID=A0A0G0W9X8_UNCC2|nr:MAG: Blue (Type 1) copper domain protein [candidate division CPR2 bacterium GW2011_GWC2_39_35]KKR28128.1 MAG: Blue (Type 1) copper domain protein [candidate division CPR2 bacterium GW2011_GWD2_39_7]KKR29547.1 MAG: Blue (Type 1) copper domain protein [candidate division CPR2 bacterium GW2011_GWD1_39_7]KKS09814.1 MAG: Blue (Type 1) copper domain protein [candidate division CPR2 bacterium GW2011_GWC1_41_48]OGB55854.1 MAG: hypothetical protein A2Y27_00325 [candidate division CPR2 bacterium GWD1_